MPTQTYTPIARQVLASATGTVTFSNISGIYTDLLFIFDGAMTTADYVLFQVGNSSVDTGANYSATRLIGNGSSATSGRSSGSTYIQFSDVMNASRNNLIAHFQNYSNTTTNKTLITRTNTPVTDAGNTGTVSAGVGLWRSTSAINIIKFYTYASQTFAAGSTFTLYGIKAGS
jgi:hypothetical protein